MRPRRGGMSLTLAITLALVLKVILLTLLYQAFFAAPQAKKMRVPAAQVEQHLLGNTAPSPAPKDHQP
ncbi:MAG: cytochrome oxidase putative small subunit CydP [Pseudomonadota bacterium]